MLIITSCFCQCQQCFPQVTQKPGSLDVLVTKHLILNNIFSNSCTWYQQGLPQGKQDDELPAWQQLHSRWKISSFSYIFAMRALLACSEFTTPHSHLLLSPMPINTKVTFLQECLKKVTLRHLLDAHRGNMHFDFHVAYSTCGISLFYLHVVTKYLFLCFIPGRSSSFSVYVILTTRTAGFAPAAWKLRETGCSTLFDFFIIIICV